MVRKVSGKEIKKVQYRLWIKLSLARQNNKIMHLMTQVLLNNSLFSHAQVNGLFKTFRHRNTGWYIDVDFMREIQLELELIISEDHC